MDIRILGPLEVSDGSGLVELGGGKQRALLVNLLLHAGEPVAAERLVDDLWGESPPASAAKSLQVLVSRLRKALGRDLVSTTSSGYVLALEGVDVDARSFTTLVREARAHAAAGDAGAAAGTLRDALALWRGPALADFVYDDFAQGEITRLEEERLAATEGRLEADLALGRHADVVGELDALVREHPLRERLRSLLMLALYRSGRSAEALEVYQAGRRALVDELGIEPGRPLQALEQAVLNQDASLDLAPAPSGGTQAPAAPRLIGRDDELAELALALDDAVLGRGRLALVSGPAGIGKTALVEELTILARARSAVVLQGRCWEAGGAPAYWPWVQSLRDYAREHDAAEAAVLSPELVQLLPELGGAVALEPESPESEGARFRLFDAVARFLRGAARTHTLVVWIDDLHAADAPSLLLLQFLAAELAQTRVLLLASYRDGPDGEAGNSQALAALARTAPVRVGLRGLDDAGVAAVVTRSAGVRPPRGLVDAIRALSEGNPLFVGEIVRLLETEGRLEEAPGGQAWRLAVPPTVRALIGRRLVSLTPSCRDLLEVAAVIGREFRLETLQTASARPAHEVLDLLAEATSADVVTEVAGSLGFLRFSHALIGETLYDELAPSRRILLHRTVRDALARLYASDPGPHLAELAHHALAAAPGGEAAKAVALARAAATRASEQLAFEEAVRLFEAALRAFELSASSDEQERCELLLSCAVAWVRAGDLVAARPRFLEASELAKRIGNHDILARAALGYSGSLPWARAGRDARVVPLLEEAVDALGRSPGALRARLLARLAGALRDDSSRERRLALGEEAVAIARTLDPSTLAYVLDGTSTSFALVDSERWLAVATEIAALGRQTSDGEREALGYLHRFGALCELGRMAAAEQDSVAMTRLAREQRNPAVLFKAIATQSTLALFGGRLEESERKAHEALEIGRRAEASEATSVHRIQLYAIRREQGRLEEVRDPIERSIEEFPRPLYPCLLADVCVESGDRAAAARLLTASMARLEDIPLDNEYLYSLSRLAEVSARLRDAGAAARLYEAMLPYAHLMNYNHPEVAAGSTERWLGVLAETRGDPEAAERHFAAAVRRNAELGARPWLAWAQADLARVVADADPARAQALAAQARQTAEELGMTALLRTAA